MAKYPLKSQDFDTSREEFTCPECERVCSTREYYSLTASGMIEKGNRGGGSEFCPADLTELELWHVIDSIARDSRKLPLSEQKYGFKANVVCCSAKCLKDYFINAVDKLSEL